MEDEPAPSSLPPSPRSSAGLTPLGTLPLPSPAVNPPPPTVTAYQYDLSHAMRVADRLAEMGTATAPVIRDAPLRLPPSGRRLGPRRLGESRARRKHVT